MKKLVKPTTLFVMTTIISLSISAQEMISPRSLSDFKVTSKFIIMYGSAYGGDHLFIDRGTGVPLYAAPAAYEGLSQVQLTDKENFWWNVVDQASGTSKTTYFTKTDNYVHASDSGHYVIIPWHLALISRDEHVKVQGNLGDYEINKDDGTTLSFSFPGSMNTIKLSDDGQWFFSSSDTLVKASTKDGKYSYKVFCGEDFVIAVSPDGKYVITSTGVYDQTGRKFILFEEAMEIVVPDWKHLKVAAGAASRDHSQLVDLATGKKFILEGSCVSRENDFLFTPDGDLVVSGCEDSFRVWNAQGQKIASPKDINSLLGLTADGSSVIATDWSSIKLVDTKSGMLIRKLQTRPEPDMGISIKGSNDGKMFYMASGTKFKLLNKEKGSELLTAVFVDSIQYVHVSPSGLYDASPGLLNKLDSIEGVANRKKKFRKEDYEPGL